MYTYEDIQATKDSEFPVSYQYGVVRTERELQYLHWHEELEIMLCEDGEGSMMCGGEETALEKGRIIVANPFELHTLSSYGGHTRQLLLVGQRMLDDIGCGETAFRHSFVDHEITEAFSRIRRESGCGDSFSRREILALVTHILVRMAREHSAGARDMGGSLEAKRGTVGRVIAYINRHFAEDISIATICAWSGYGKSQLCHIFREVTGQTISGQITVCRLNNARTLLSTGKYSVSECAAQCGFSSASYFTKVYRKAYGKCPSEEVNSEK